MFDLQIPVSRREHIREAECAFAAIACIFWVSRKKLMSRPNLAYSSGSNSFVKERLLRVFLSFITQGFSKLCWKKWMKWTDQPFKVRWSHAMRIDV